MSKDWRSGTLLGAGYAMLANGKAVAVGLNRTALTTHLRQVAERMSINPDLVEANIKQVCIVLPPWDSTPPSPSAGEPR